MNTVKRVDAPAPGQRPRVTIELVRTKPTFQCSGCGQETPQIHEVTRRCVRDLPILDADTSASVQADGHEVCPRHLARLPLRGHCPDDSGSRGRGGAWGFRQEQEGECTVNAGQEKGLKGYLKLTTADLARAVKQRSQVTQTILEMLTVLMLCSRRRSSAKRSRSRPTSAHAGRWRGTSVLGALAGVPGLSVPMDFGPTGLPSASPSPAISLQNTILQIGMIFQRETDWHRRRPPV